MANSLYLILVSLLGGDTQEFCISLISESRVQILNLYNPLGSIKTLAGLLIAAGYKDVVHLGSIWVALNEQVKLLGTIGQDSANL